MRQAFEREVDQLRTELEKTQNENRELRVAIERCQREGGELKEQSTTGGGYQPDFKTSLLADSLRAENEQLKEKVMFTTLPIFLLSDMSVAIHECVTYWQ